MSSIGTGVLDHPTLTTVENDWDDASWRLDLEYAPTDDILVYAGVATGFKSGGVTTTRLPSGEFDSFDPENLTAFEVGVNSQWLDQRLTFNGAAFNYDFSDMQISSTFVYNRNLISDVENSAKAEIYGLDFAANFQCNDRLKLSAGVVWMPKREFVEFVSEWLGDRLSGNTISRAPEWSAATAMDYKLPLQGLGDLTLRLEYNYRSHFYFTKENNPFEEQGSFGLLNIFLDFEPANQHWHMFASGRNLTNADYYNSISFQSSPGYPATFEVGVGMRF